MNIVRPTTPAQAGERHRLAQRQPGPVTVAIRAVRGVDPEREALQVLRATIAARIAADVALLDRLDAGEAA